MRKSFVGQASIEAPIEFPSIELSPGAAKCLVCEQQHEGHWSLHLPLGLYSIWSSYEFM